MSGFATFLAWLSILAGSALLAGFWVYHHVAWPLTFPWRVRRVMVDLGLVGRARPSERGGSGWFGLLVIATFAIVAWRLGDALSAFGFWSQIATWLIAALAAIAVLAPHPTSQQPKLHRKRRAGHVWHLVWSMPVGVHSDRLQAQRVALEEALDCSISRIWSDRGRLHMRMGRGRMPELHALEDVDAAPADGLRVHLGASREGRLDSDVSAWPHGIVGGTSGGGKTACVQSIVLQLVQQNGPEALQLVLVDLKGAVDLGVFDRLPHLRWPVIGRHDEAAAALTELVDEQERRQDQLRQAGCPNIGEWNRRFPEQRLAHVLLVIDEFADLLPKEAATKDERAVREAAWAAVSSLTRMGRASGIHVVIATQRPDADVLPGQIRANCPVKVAFFCADEFLSGILLGQGNAAAARLPCRPDGQPLPGRAIFKWGHQVPFQAAHMPARQIERAVEEIRARYAQRPALAPAPQPAMTPLVSGAEEA